MIFNANLDATNDKLSCYVIHKHLVIDSEIFIKEFDMDPNPQKLIAASPPNYNKDLAINFLFPY